MPKASMLLLKSCVSINPLDAASSKQKNKMHVPVYFGEETSHFSINPLDAASSIEKNKKNVPV